MDKNRTLKCSYFDIFDVLNKAAKIFLLKKNFITLLLRTCYGLSNSLKILIVSGKDSCYLYALHGLSAPIPTTFPLIHPFSLLLTPAGSTYFRAFSLLDIVRLIPYLFCVFVSAIRPMLTNLFKNCNSLHLHTPNLPSLINFFSCSIYHLLS